MVRTKADDDGSEDDNENVFFQFSLRRGLEMRVESYSLRNGSRSVSPWTILLLLLLLPSPPSSSSTPLPCLVRPSLQAWGRRDCGTYLKDWVIEQKVMGEWELLDQQSSHLLDGNRQTLHHFKIDTELGVSLFFLPLFSS